MTFYDLHRQALYPGDVYDVRVVRDTGELPKLLRTHRKVEKKLSTLGRKQGPTWCTATP